MEGHLRLQNLALLNLRSNISTRNVWFTKTAE